MTQPQHLLFLIADTGGGHRASANAVAEQLNTQFPSAFEITIVDPFAQTAPGIAEHIVGLYGPLARRARWVWGALYHATNSRVMVKAVSGSILRINAPGIRKLIRTQKPSVVVSFHPLLNHVTARVINNLPKDQRPPFLTVVTDFVSLHRFWFCPGVSSIIVPTESARQDCDRAKIPNTLCHVLGLPVNSTFDAPPPTTEEQKALRLQLGVASERKLVVICGGGDGAGKLFPLTTALLDTDLPIDIVVICGHNAALVRKLTPYESATPRTVRVFGFIHNMSDWLRAADLVVTKAGPGTIMETLCSGTPMVLCWYIPGQERGNVEWIRDHGLGDYSSHPKKLVRIIQKMLVTKEATRSAISEKISAAATPHAASDIAVLIHSYADAESSKVPS